MSSSISDINSFLEEDTVAVENNSPTFQPYHPGIPSIDQAQANYNNFYSDHIPIMVEIDDGDSALRIVSWNVMESDLFNGVSPLGQGNYGETDEQRNNRYARIADAILQMLQVQQPDFVTLQEIRAYFPDEDGSLRVLPDGLWAAISTRLEGTDYSPASYNDRVIDTAGNITLYNRAKFNIEVTPPVGIQQVASLPREFRELGAHQLVFKQIDKANLPNKIRLCNVHADYSDVPSTHERLVRNFLNSQDDCDTGIVVGDFNCMFDTYNNNKISATSAVPNTFRNNQIQGVCAIDGAFYKTQTNSVCRAMVTHLNPNTGSPWPQEALALPNLDDMPENQREEMTRFRMVMCAKDRAENQIGTASFPVSLKAARNMQNEEAVAVVFSNEKNQFFENIGLISSSVLDQISGTTCRVAYLPLGPSSRNTINNEIIPAIFKDVFMTAYRERLQQDRNGFFGWFRKSRVNDAMVLSQIIQHAQNDNNRSRAICVQLGWLDINGEATATTPDAIKNILNNNQENQNQAGNSI